MNISQSDQCKLYRWSSLHDFRGGLSKVISCDDADPPFETRQLLVSSTLRAHTFRGFHSQIGTYSESKIVSCLEGSLLWFAVKPAKEQSDFRCFTFELTGGDCLFIPRGHLNGMLTTTDNVELIIASDRCYSERAGVNINPKGNLFFKEEYLLYSIETAIRDEKTNLLRQDQYYQKFIS